MDTVDEIVGFEEPGDEVDQLAYEVIGAAIEVHRELGDSYLELCYEESLCVELELRGISFEKQYPCDLLPIHSAQDISYLKVTGRRLGLLLNFNVTRHKNGVRRIARTR
jgi:hypothetical protein